MNTLPYHLSLFLPVGLPEDGNGRDEERKRQFMLQTGGKREKEGERERRVISLSMVSLFHMFASRV